MRNIFLAWVLFWMSWVPLWGQGPVQQAFVTTPAPSGASTNTFTFSQFVQAACNTPTCTPTITTSSGHLIHIFQGQTATGTSSPISAVSGGCSGSWVIPAAAQIAVSSAQSVSAAYCLSSSSGTNPITVSVPVNSQIYIWDYSFSPGPAALDVCGTANDNTSQTPQPGTALTLSGTKDVIFQGLNGGNAVVNSITVYSRFNNGGVVNASAVLENTSSGTAPSWTLSAAATMSSNACAYK